MQDLISLISQFLYFLLVVMVAHYTPSSFPMIPMINAASSKLCQESWDRIVAQIVTHDDGMSMSHICVCMVIYMLNILIYMNIYFSMI